MKKFYEKLIIYDKFYEICNCKIKVEKKEVRMMDKVKNITIRVPAELKEKLKQEADSKGYPMKDLINFILWNYLKSTVRE